jgi:hypothetical protein
MKPKRNSTLITKVLIIGAVIAVLSYLFHPDVGQLMVSFNGQPVADPLVRFAAVPSFLLMMFLTGLLMLLLFLGVGAMMFIVVLVAAFAFGVMLVPYFWPMLVIIFLIIALTAVSHDEKE